jgi:hypothetical protein
MIEILKHDYTAQQGDDPATVGLATEVLTPKLFALNGNAPRHTVLELRERTAQMNQKARAGAFRQLASDPGLVETVLRNDIVTMVAIARVQHTTRACSQIHGRAG